MKDAAIIVTTWSWRKDLAPNAMWCAAMASAAVGKYHYGIDGAGNVFAALCGFYAFIGLVLFFATPTTYLQGRPWLVRLVNQAILLALIAATAWFGNWWLFASLVTAWVGLRVHRLKAEKLHAEQHP